MNTIDCDFAIVGGGLAGSAAAYWLSRLGDVTLVMKQPAERSNSAFAQGGIAAAVGAGDSPERHAEDTLLAGDGLCRPDAVRLLTARAPELIRWMVELGVPFDRDMHGQLQLGLEGAHSFPRILHAGGDATGRHIVAALRQALVLNPNVQRLEDAYATRLAVGPYGGVHGVFVRSAQSAAETLLIARRATILATGGVGQLFACTTNPPGALGDGIALAFRAGATLRNMEFVQFHPTALDTGENPCLLLTEALRGAGARLVDASGRPILAHHPLRDLAPRDVVARAVFEQREQGRQVFLDCRGITGLADRFPTVYEGCRVAGFDPVSDPLPVTPAAHFLMGGVAAAMTGETDVPGLYALGETANTGCHGANRLASNSLLECVVMSYELYCAQKAADSANRSSFNSSRDVAGMLGSLPEPPGFTPDNPRLLQDVQNILWQCAGVVRDESSLATARAQLAALSEDHPNSAALCTAQRIVESALLRRESRGAHFRRDYPQPDPRLAGMDTLLRAGQPAVQIPV